MEVPVPTFQLMAFEIVPADWLMVCVPEALTNEMVAVPPPDLDKIPPVCEKLPETEIVGVEVPLVTSKLPPEMTKLPPMLRDGEAGEPALYLSDPVPVLETVKFP